MGERAVIIFERDCLKIRVIKRSVDNFQNSLLPVIGLITDNRESFIPGSYVLFIGNCFQSLFLIFSSSNHKSFGKAGSSRQCLMSISLSYIDKIRVTEICRAADIERPTFYYHFKDKYDLVAWMFCTDAYGTDITSVPSAAAGMNKMKQELLFYKRAYEDSSQNALWHYMVEYFTRRYTELAKEKLGTDILDTQLAYSIRFYCMGSVGITQEWVLSDNITSAETVVQMMFNSMPENLRKILF